MQNVAEDYESMARQLTQKQNVTDLGEPQAFIELPNGRTLEVVHEQYGLSEREQYFSFRIHCSDEEFDQNAFQNTNGIVDQTSSGSVSKDACISLLQWAYAVAEKC